MNRYETIYIVNSDLDGESRQAVIERFKALVEANGELKVFEEWGQRKLAYPINDRNDGFYVFMEYRAEPDFPTELERNFKISDDILKFITIRKEDKDSVHTVSFANQGGYAPAGAAEEGAAGEGAAAEGEGVPSESAAAEGATEAVAEAAADGTAAEVAADGAAAEAAEAATEAAESVAEAAESVAEAADGAEQAAEAAEAVAEAVADDAEGGAEGAGAGDEPGEVEA